MFNAGALLAAVVTVTAIGGAGAAAQTLTSPDPKPVPSSHARSKSQAQERLKPCPAYGPGFVQFPGGNACIKIGGGVTTDAGMGR